MLSWTPQPQRSAPPMRWKARAIGPADFCRGMTLALVVAGSCWWMLDEIPTAGVEPATVPAEVNAAQATPPPSSARNIAPIHRYVGVASCAAANCHGGDGSQKPLAGAYRIWAQRDRHAEAYAVLYNEKSRRIAMLLGLETPAHQAERCLDCHATHAKEAELAADHRFELRDGVGCESCHGPSAAWRDAHVRFDWKTRVAGLTAEQKFEQYGFIDTADLLTRARLCAECHVGSPRRQVDHDLIAAGHPPLKFELTAFLSQLPPHWDRDGDARRHSPAVEAKLWAIGQIVSAEAAVALLKSRAADENAVWPEFAEYDCFACHHDLSSPSWRQERSIAQVNRRLGELPWGTWYFPLLSTLANEPGGAGAPKLKEAFDELAQAMRRPYPNRNAVTIRADAVEGLLATWTGEIAPGLLPARSVKTRLAHVAKDAPALAGEGWNAVAQVYAAVAALQRAHEAVLGSAKAENHAAVRTELETIRCQLKFPEEYDSPRGFGRVEVERIQTSLRRIQQLLDNQ